jgi:hypothetical protein
VHIEPSTGRIFIACSKLSAYVNVVTLVTKRVTYRVWVLQCYLQLLEQYLALCYTLKVI